MSLTVIHNVFKVVVGLMALLGAVSIFPLTLSTLTGGASCPSISIIPACYIVFLGFCMMVLFAIFEKPIFFIIGWTPVAFIALFASYSELTVGNICPLSSTGVPLCFYSFGASLIILLNFILWKVFKNKANLRLTA